jgi:hypothetical protein
MKDFGPAWLLYALALSSSSYALTALRVHTDPLKFFSVPRRIHSIRDPQGHIRGYEARAIRVARV